MAGNRLIEVTFPFTVGFLDGAITAAFLVVASKDTIQTLAEKSGIGIDDLIKFNLDPKENIGSKKTSIGRVIRGKEKGNIPTEEQFKRLLELGISFENKGKLQQAKQNRDVAIERNNKAKELEGQVSEQLKKRGKNHGEQ